MPRFRSGAGSYVGIGLCEASRGLGRTGHLPVESQAEAAAGDVFRPGQVCGVGVHINRGGWSGLCTLDRE